MAEPKDSGKGGKAKPKSKAKRTASPGKAKSTRRSSRTRAKRAETSAQQGEQGERNEFPVVALGASAGGLGALKEFFSAVPDDCGMAFVVIQHLSPKHKSTLPELLSQHTSMSIQAAEDGKVLEPNQVYVIPPDRFLSVKDKKLKLTELPAKDHLSVDYFLRSLAEDQQERAFAVILSGTGSDGTLGVQAVKGNDGLVAVQSPDSAEYPGMPTSAIDTAVVDFILPVADIPRALVDYARQLLGAPGEAKPTEPPRRTKALTEILSVLREHTGHDFSGYKINTVLRRVARRMAIHGTDSHGKYLRLLQEQPDEIDHLYTELLIPVTGFFRDADAFRVLNDTVIPQLLENRRPDESLRVWVPGCSTGEEAYSIAIVFKELIDEMDDPPTVQIFATDLDVGALEKARRGRYPASISLDVPESRLRRYFRRDGDFFEVNPSIREMLVFAKQDVIKDAPFSRVDLISCRNLLIYLGLELQRRLLPVFHYALKPRGYLFLGSAESVGNMDDLFAVVDRRWKIYQRRDNEMARREYYNLPQFSKAAANQKVIPEMKQREEPADYGTLVRGLLLRDHVPAAVLINGQNQVLYLHGNTGNFIELTTGHLTDELLRMVRAGLEGLVRSVIQRVRSEKTGRASGTGRVQIGGRSERVQITARGLGDPDAPPGAVLLLFEDLGPEEESTGKSRSRSETEEHGDRTVAELERELGETREELKTTAEELEASNEELQSSNEELQSSNEELQSSNEELETSREELQSVNDELRSVNIELEKKVEEANRAKEDMNIMLASTEIGVVFVDKELHIERFTPAVTDIIPIRETDIGRPIEDLSHKLDSEDIQSNLKEVVSSLVRQQQEVRGRDGHVYMMRMRPYRSAAGQVMGAVLVFVDVTEEADLAFLGKLRDALGQSEDPVLLLSLEGGVEYVNDAYCDATGYQPEEVVGSKTDALATPGLSADDRRQMDWNLRHGRSWRGEFRCQVRSGGELVTQAFFAPIRTGDGHVSHAVAYLQLADEDR